jgi:PBP4 family serine-type D-alanyl-D-alanine carboxypeptidase
VSDVYLVGRGDPGLSCRPGVGRATAFEELAQALRTAGLRRIEGRLIGHEGLFRGERRGVDWSWEDLVWSYGAEVSALSLDENVALLTVSAGERPGDPVAVDRSPASSYYRVVSTATTAPVGGKSDLALSRASGSNVIRLSGTHPAGAPAELLPVALEDPARFAATVFAEVLEASGIRVAGPVETSSDPLPPGIRVLAARDSEPLSEILKAVNKLSRNLHAEMLLRLLGAHAKGEGSANAGHAAVQDFLARAGVRSEGGALHDGSGLSRSDILSPAGLVELLVAMDRHRYARPFRESLAVAGIDGTLENRMRGTPAAGRILAKTGTLRQVGALAGYSSSRSGERLAFALLVNNFTVSGVEVNSAIDAICALLVE